MECSYYKMEEISLCYLTKTKYCKILKISCFEGAKIDSLSIGGTSEERDREERFQGKTEIQQKIRERSEN